MSPTESNRDRAIRALEAASESVPGLYPGDQVLAQAQIANAYALLSIYSALADIRNELRGRDGGSIPPTPSRGGLSDL